MFRVARRTVVCLSAFATLAGCGVEGSGNKAIDARTVDAFATVTLAGAFNARVHVDGSEHTVRISGDDNLVPLITTEVRNGELILASTKPLSPDVPLKVEVATPALTAATLGGAGTLDLTNVAGDAMRLDASGAGRIIAAGSVKTLEIALSGAGAIDTSSVVATNVKASMSGAGAIVLQATETLDATVSGAGSIRYSGDPEVTKSVSGVGTVEKL